MTIIAAISYRKPKKVSLVSSLLSGLIALLSLGALVFLGNIRIEPIIGLPLLVLGLLLGFLRGQAVKLNWEDEVVIGRNSILFLIVWGFSLALSQFLGLLGSSLLASLGLIPAVFSTGLQLGYYGNIFLRRLFMRPGRESRIMNAVIGIGGTAALVLLAALSLVLSVPDLVRRLPNIGSAVQAAEGPASAAPSLDQPSSGELIINCSDQEGRVKGHSLADYNMQGTSYSFEQAFTDYQVSLVMELDPASKEFALDYAVLEAWRWQEYDADLHPPEYATLTNFLEAVSGQGNLTEDGWISGEFDIVRQTWDDPEDKNTEVDQNSFNGYLDESQGSIAICLLPVLGDRSDEISGVDLELLKASGKDQLVPNWWSENDCFICAVE
jgi:hypothetical protein